jgi:hypothetical protein
VKPLPKLCLDTGRLVHSALTQAAGISIVPRPREELFRALK